MVRSTKDDSGDVRAMLNSEEQWLAYYAQAGGRPLRDFAYFKQFAAYLILVAVVALQRNMDEDSRAGQEPLLRPLWAMTGV